VAREGPHLSKHGWAGIKAGPGGFMTLHALSSVTTQCWPAVCLYRDL
jgi:hypothetical protein